jgi:hypothetical protein
MLAVLLLAGCVVLGKNTDYQPFDPAFLEPLIPGQSKAADVCKVLGAPTRVVELSNGNAYIYERAVTKGTALWLLLVSFVNAERQHDQVVFFFDTSDTLTHYGVSFNAGKASYGLPF